MSKIRYRDIPTLDFVFGALNRDLKLIFVSNFVGSFGDGLYFFILPLYMRALGAAPVEVGIAFSVLTLVCALTLIFGGFLADKYDRKMIMVLSWLAWIPVPLIFSLADDWRQMLPGMVLYGCWISGPASSAYIATSAEKGKMTLIFSILSAGWALGYIFSPALGGYLYTVIGMRWVFRFSSILFALSMIILLFMSSQHVAIKTCQPQSPFVSFKTKKILVWSFFFAVIMFVTGLVRPFIPQFLQDAYYFNDFLIGLLGSITSLGSAVLGVFIGRIGDRWKKGGAVSVSMILCCVSVLTLISFNNFFALTFASFLMGPSYATWSLMGAVIGSLAPEASRGRWMSVPQTVSMLAAFLAPYLGGWLYEASHYHPFIVAIAITPLLSVLALTKQLEERA